MAYSTSWKVAARALCAVALLLGTPIGSETVKGAKSLGFLRVVSSGRPQASIVLGKAAGELTKYAATELQKYLRILSGAEVPIISEDGVSSRPSKEALILVGGPSSNPAIREAAQARWVDFSGLKPEGFVIKTGDFKGHPAIVSGGNDDASAMYAAYDLIERLGVTFTLAGDALPAVRPDLAIPVMDIRLNPAFSRRGFLLQSGGFINLSVFSYPDYVKFLDQMAKMKCNYLQFWWFSYEPWLKYSYKGEPMWMGDVSTKDSGYFAWARSGGGSHTTDDVSIGKEHFKGRRLAPQEFQTVETPEEAFNVAGDLLRRVIHHAHERGIKVWPAVELASLPPNLARYCERVGELPFHPIFGTFVHPLDPVNREIQVNRFKALIENYPEAEGYFFVFAEMYPELNNEKYHAFFVQQRPAFHDLRRLRIPWIDWGGGGGDDRLVDSNIGFTDLFKFLMTKRDEIAPKVKMGVLGIGRGYTLPLLDKMLPKDVPFTDMESSGVWTPAGVPMDYFGGMENRERTLEPRVDDDINMMGMQFSVKQYSAEDRIFTDGVKYGLSGFAGQLNRARGTETNSRFLAEAAWSPQLTAEEFYKNYSRRLFGEPAATDMYNAYMALEENEAWLGYYNYGYSTMNCCGALEEVSRAYEYSRQDNPFDGPAGSAWQSFISKSPDVINRFEGSIRLLNRALGNMRAAMPNVAPQGKYELGYMINRTESYRDYIQSLIIIRQAYLDFDQAFKDRTHVPYEQFIANLEKSLGGFDAANEQAQAATRHYAEIIDHPSDLGVLYHLNARAVLGFSLTRQWMRNVVNFHKGKPYLDHVPFERLFSPDLHTGTAK
jgi:hypothetical protein